MKDHDSKFGHPRQHSLAMASADHLHKAGYMSAQHRDAVRKSAGKKLADHKKTKAEYGSLAPESAGHYMTTGNPIMSDDDQDGM